MGTERLGNERLSLRAFESDDLAALHAYFNDPSLIGRRYMPWGIRDNAPMSRRDVEGILEAWAKVKKAFTLGIELRESGVLAGHAECNWRWDTHCPGVAVAVSPEHQRRRIGSEVVGLLLAYFFENTPAHNVSGWISSWNEPGLAFALALGFTESGRIPRGGIRDGVFYEEVMVDILKPEWAATESGSNAS